MSCKSQIISAFNLHGYTLRREALNYLEERLEDLERSERQEELKKLIDYVNVQSLSSSLVEKETIELAFSSLVPVSAEDGVLFKVYDSFSLNRYTYISDSKKFFNWSQIFNKPPVLHGCPDSKADIFIEKYKMVHQRTARHKLFAAPAIGTSSQPKNFTLKAVENLLGSSSKETNVILLGMLTQLKEGQFFIEDPTGIVKLDLSKATYKSGLFTENNIVLAEGYYEERVFYVTTMGFPPPELAEVTLSHFPNLCITPFSSINSHRLSSKLKRAEEANGEAMFVFLSDVWLDQLKVLQKLQVLFAGYSVMPPTCFVLIGNFLSLPAGPETNTFAECFSELGTLICEHPSLVKGSHFVFVPGPDDPGLPHILPRPGIPSNFLGDFQKKVPSAIFTSNPCRIQYCTQDIVVFRDNIISKMCRNSIYTPWKHEEKVDIPHLFVKTVISNSHLMPLPLNIAPIYWEYDYAFWLYPLPSVVVCADKHDPYTVTDSDCIFFNPGSLPTSNFSFKVYFPAMKEVEDSEISDDF